MFDLNDIYRKSVAKSSGMTWERNDSDQISFVWRRVVQLEQLQRLVAVKADVWEVPVYGNVPEY